MSLNYNYVPSLRRESTAAVAGGLSRPQLSLGFMGDALDSRISFSRGTYATQYDNQGNLVFAPMNLIRNNRAVGAATGTPGTMPTNWSIFTSLTGLTTSIVDVGFFNNFDYIDIRIVGTPSASGALNVYFDTTTAIPAVIGQIYTAAVNARLSSGSNAGISGASIRFDERDISGNYLGVKAGATFTLQNALLADQRKSVSATLTTAGTAYVMPYIAILLTGAAVDITFRIANPTLELDTIVRADNAVLWPMSLNKTSGSVYYGPRSDYDTNTIDRQNLITYSELFSDVSWGAIGTPYVTLSGDDDPNGTKNAYILADNDTGVFEGIGASITVPNDSATYTFSVFVKKSIVGSDSSFGANISLLNGTRIDKYPRYNTQLGTISSEPATSTITSFNDDWWRVTSTITNNASGNTTLNVQLYGNLSGGASSVGSSVIFGAQVNTGATALPYYKTTGSAVTTYARKGTLIEETRINSIRNSVGLGAVAGTPGTMPTNWIFFLNSITGISSTIVGVNQDKGVPYLEIRIFGTPSATVAQGIQITFEGSNIIGAAASQVWTQSLWCKIVGGSTANISAFNLNTQQYNAGAFVQSNNNAFTPTSALVRYSSTVTFSASTTTHAVPVLGIGTTAGQAIDITLRIGLPQLELGSHASSAIPTYGTQYTRQFDNLDITSIGSWFNASEGTLYGETVLDRILPTSGAGAFPGIFHIADGTSANRIVLTAYSPGATNNYYGTVITGGVDQGSLGTNAFAANTIVRGAYAYKANDAAFSANGSTAVVDNTVTLPTGLNIANFGGTLSAGANKLNGWLRNIKYYNTRLSNANLQKLTT